MHASFIPFINRTHVIHQFLSYSFEQSVERRGEMIVRILEARCIGGRQAVEAAQKLLAKGDARHTVHVRYSF